MTDKWKEFREHLKLTGREIPKYEPKTPEEAAKLKLAEYKRRITDELNNTDNAE